MLAIVVTLFLALAAATLWPELPISQAICKLTFKAINTVSARGFQVRALLAIGAAMLLYAAIWALAGDAPMFLAMILPELASWFATFEIATLAEALVGIGSAYVATRSVGLRNYVKGRFRARRTRRGAAVPRKSANDDEPAGRMLAA